MGADILKVLEEDLLFALDEDEVGVDRHAGFPRKREVRRCVVDGNRPYFDATVTA